MTGRHWFRKDVLFPLIILVIFGYGIYWIWQKMAERPELHDNKMFYYAFITGLIVYAVLAVITIRHAVSSYSLERFNPGNPQSLKRLRRMRRFHLSANIKKRLDNWVDPTEDITQWLNDLGYNADARTPHGRVFIKPRKVIFWTRPTPVDRVFVLQHNLLNVLVIDQLLKDSIRFIKQQNEKPSPRNLLILVMTRTDDNEAVSAAAGIVNFLGKFNGGTLGVLLLDVIHGRLFYPIDRSLQPRSHRRYQDLFRLKLIHWLYKKPMLVRKSGPAPLQDQPEVKNSAVQTAGRSNQHGNHADRPQIRQFTLPEDDYEFHSDDEEKDSRQ
jgi:hypothetical protein